MVFINDLSNALIEIIRKPLKIDLIPDNCPGCEFVT